MKSKNPTTEKVLRSKRKIKAKMIISSDRPRLSIFRSNKFIYAQVIDDTKGKTLAQASDAKLKGTKIERAEKVGAKIAEESKKAGITKVVFDRGGRKYMGRIKTLAESARTAGLEF